MSSLINALEGAAVNAAAGAAGGGRESAAGAAAPAVQAAPAAAAPTPVVAEASASADPTLTDQVSFDIHPDHVGIAMLTPYVQNRHNKSPPSKGWARLKRLLPVKGSLLPNKREILLGSTAH